MKNRTYVTTFLILALLFTFSNAEAQQNYTNDKPAYIIYNSNGVKVTYSQMLKAVAATDICFFGELHNDAMSHWLELELVKDLHRLKKTNLVVGAEMWEADNQIVLDEMLNSKFIDFNTYIESSVLWSNFTTDYKPILQYAHKNEIPFVATNVPRRYARIVSKRGEAALDSLSPKAKSYIAPLPIPMDFNNKFYEYIANIFKETMHSSLSSIALGNLVKAQMVKDATMAHFIVTNLPKGGYFFHFNGELHSAFNSAIGHYVKIYAPNLRFKTISIIQKQNVNSFSANESRADFNIVIPANMSVSYVN
ncbi:MAG: ChaN family lipoprotein [Bacteroidales bacterium]|nr:ChaN family lipoprotein [Bacteroidales bacterium]